MTIEIHLVDEKETPFSEDFCVTDNYIYLCGRNTNPTPFFTANLGSFWNDKYDQKQVIYLEGAVNDIGPLANISNNLYVANGEREFYKLLGAEIIKKITMEDLFESNPKICDVGTDGKFLYVHTFVLTEEKECEEGTSILDEDLNLTEILSQVFYNGYNANDKIFFEKELDGEKEDEEENFDVFSKGNYVETIKIPFDNMNKQTNVLGYDNYEYIFTPFTDGKELYILSSEGSVWHIGKKQTKIFQGYYEPTGSLTTHNSKYGFILVDNWLKIFSNGEMITEQEMPIHEKDVNMLGASGKFLYFLFDDKIQRYYMLD